MPIYDIIYHETIRLKHINQERLAVPTVYALGGETMISWSKAQVDIV
jgi:hypothetical protein